MPKATWNGVTLADSNDTVVVEGNHYFPIDAVDPALLKPSATTTVCGWKGTANYYTIDAGGAENKDRRLVLRRPQGRRRRDQGPRGVLEGRQGRVSFGK